MSEFADSQPAPNIHDAPDLYEVENRAIDPDGILLDALRAVAPWDGRDMVDLGCGTGFWLPGYAVDAATVIGVEPDPDLLVAAERRVAGIGNASVVAGSAEHLRFPDQTIDLVHARFAYFFGAGSEAGISEVMRVLRRGGSLVVIDTTTPTASSPTSFGLRREGTPRSTLAPSTNGGMTKARAAATSCRRGNLGAGRISKRCCTTSSATDQRNAGLTPTPAAPRSATATRSSH
jgi:SAM-dependent methyltransferase